MGVLDFSLILATIILSDVGKVKPTKSGGILHEQKNCCYYWQSSKEGQ